MVNVFHSMDSMGNIMTPKMMMLEDEFPFQ